MKLYEELYQLLPNSVISKFCRHKKSHYSVVLYM